MGKTQRQRQFFVLDKANVENVEGETETLKFIEGNVKQSNKLWQHWGRVGQGEFSWEAKLLMLLLVLH